MAEKRDFKRKAAAKMQATVPDASPASIGEFLDRQSGSPVNRTTGDPGKKVRAEYKLSEKLTELVREYAHQQRMNKSDVVAQALEEYFQEREL